MGVNQEDTIGHSQETFKQGNSDSSLWASVYKSGKEGKNQGSGFDGSSTSGNVWNSSSSTSSNRLDSKPSLWASEYKSWKDSQNQAAGFGGSSTSQNGWNSSSSSSSSKSRLDWNKVVNDVFKEREDNK
eukprot:GFUD01002332.1.p2 GENE.GFUD01002332.1~~GFUD01002332.1.p2  ORF type:complete len:129 (+),score=42.89 GFUD01002332.1:58-444(+)